MAAANTRLSAQTMTVVRDLPGTGAEESLGNAGTLGLIAEHGHHAALGGVVEVVAVGHPLAGLAASNSQATC